MEVIASMFQKLFIKSRMPGSFFVLCAIIGGIVLQSIYCFSLSSLLFCSLFFGIGIMGFYWYSHSPEYMWAFVLVLAPFLGAIRYQISWQEFNSFYEQIGRFPIALYGTVIEIKETKSSYTPLCLTMNLNAYKKEQDNSFCTTVTDKNVQIYTRILPDIRVGDEIVCRNMRCSTTPDDAFSSYLMKHEIAATFFVPLLQLELIGRPKFNSSRFFFETKQRILKTVKNAVSPQTATLFSSLFLGCRESERENNLPLIDNFKKWGISHLVARSGIHLTLFIWAWYAFLRIIPVPLFYKQIMLIIIAFLYYLLSWSSISFLRAFYTFLACRIITLTGNGYHFLHILILVCITLLIYNPIELFFLDFQLSFGLTCAIAWLNNHPR